MVYTSLDDASLGISDCSFTLVRNVQGKLWSFPLNYYYLILALHNIIYSRLLTSHIFTAIVSAVWRLSRSSLSVVCFFLLGNNNSYCTICNIHQNKMLVFFFFIWLSPDDVRGGIISPRETWNDSKANYIEKWVDFLILCFAYRLATFSFRRFRDGGYREPVKSTRDIFLSRRISPIYLE